MSLLAHLSLIVCVLGGTEGLLCYNCASSKPSNNLCQEDHQGLLNSSIDYTREGQVGGYLTNCTADKLTWDRCMILTRHLESGSMTLYQRGCTGSYLNFADPRFENLLAYNQTVCSLVINQNTGNSKGVVCYTFCQEDYCNGPQPPPVNSSDPCANYTGLDPYYDFVPAECGASCLLYSRPSHLFNLLLVGVVCVLLAGRK